LTRQSRCCSSMRPGLASRIVLPISDANTTTENPQTAAAGIVPGYGRRRSITANAKVMAAAPMAA
jgi:hypothetical protein